MSLNGEIVNWKNIFVEAIIRSDVSWKQKLTITYKIPYLLPTARGDGLEIERVVQNLLNNALHASELTGQVSLEVASFGVDKVKVSVRDNGPLLAPQEKERLFHSFIQARGRRSRSGLDLYLCRKIVETHGGTIGVESTLSEGNTFWFTLPVGFHVRQSS
jgi:signal transduction histidine kinase